ncbi:MAG: DUF3107 domain-containing protein [Marmoricola sp.]
MEVKIGVQNASRELSIYTSLDADELQEAVEDAVSSGGVLALSDTKGRRIVVPAATLAYVDISQPVSGTVGSSAELGLSQRSEKPTIEPAGAPSGRVFAEFSDCRGLGEPWTSDISPRKRRRTVMRGAQGIPSRTTRLTGDRRAETLPASSKE